MCSLGDFVSNTTIARLGYPNMALSACFGGPMLNILLGIGLSGIYLLVTRSENYHHRHPHRPERHESYHIDIEGSLVVSSVALLVMLAGLAVAVPWGGWRMSRVVGCVLVGVWMVGTGVGVAVEVRG